jgi:hypothetical protein
MSPSAKLLLFLFFLFILLEGESQILFKGMVVDSITVESLPGVHVKLKNGTHGVITDPQGIFTIKAKQTDTLVITLIGYQALELPLLLEEDVLIIRLREHVKMLREVTIQSTRLQANTVTRTTRTPPKPISSATPYSSPFDYFSKWQREKRKLLKLIRENDRTITYLQVVSDQEIREDLMERFELSEEQYYRLLAKFNEQSNHIQYETNPEKVVQALKSFLENQLR